jgi:hypothetical protein
MTSAEVLTHTIKSVVAARTEVRRAVERAEAEAIVAAFRELARRRLDARLARVGRRI